MPPSFPSFLPSHGCALLAVFFCNIDFLTSLICLLLLCFLWTPGMPFYLSATVILCERDWPAAFIFTSLSSLFLASKLLDCKLSINTFMKVTSVKLNVGLMPLFIHADPLSPYHPVWSDGLTNELQMVLIYPFGLAFQFCFCCDRWWACCLGGCTSDFFLNYINQLFDLFSSSSVNMVYLSMQTVKMFSTCGTLHRFELFRLENQQCSQSRKKIEPKRL